ncbi:MAG: hypothetical protein EOO91_14575 [Pedobacter sp.]|nr:MAG: hypothetical protein EOO91_14575 [Pedobacter sp.]
MKKHLLITALFFFIGFVKAQIPIINSNVTDQFKNSSLVYEAFHKKYDLLIAFHLEGTTKFGVTNIQIIAVKRNKWKKILFTYQDQNPLKRRIKTKSLNDTLGAKLISDLNANNFWTLDNDSINSRILKIKTPVVKTLSKDTVYIFGSRSVQRPEMNDGVGYYFKILQGDKLRSYIAYNPDFYVKYYPSKQREQFINSREAFLITLSYLGNMKQ